MTITLFETNVYCCAVLYLNIFLYGLWFEKKCVLLLLFCYQANILRIQTNDDYNF